MYRKLFAILNHSSVVLCANQRLASHLQHSYHEFQQKKGLTAWPSVAIFPLNVWLAQQWQHHETSYGKLLNEHEETFLWQTIIRESPGSDLLLQITKTAQLAQQAWQTLILWQTELTQLDAYDHQDITQFMVWARSFQEKKEKQGWVSMAELTPIITDFIHRQKLYLPETIISVGFDDLSPATEKLLQTFSEYSHYRAYQAEIIPHSITRVELKDQEQEIRAMAHWAKKKYQPNSSYKIACIVPNLSHIRERVASIFNEIFCHKNIIPGHTQEEVPYNISAGTALFHAPMVHSAIMTLASFLFPLKNDHLQAFLLSPYINNTSEDRCLTAKVAWELYALSEHVLTEETVTTIIASTTEHEFPNNQFLERWKNTCSIREKTPPYNQLQAWAEHFSKLLNSIGWPGQRSLDSREYQLLQRWQQVLLELCKLDTLFPSTTATEAFHLLSELCQQTIFQAQSNNEPIQILGLLEASGSQFKHLWIMGLDDEAWPPKAEPNPFIPLELQRKYDMPHASAQRELRYSQQLQHRLCHSAEHVTLSSAQQQGDKKLSPSPLIKSITMTLPEIERPPIVIKNNALETLCDHQGPPLGTQEDIRGGSWILREQALCPFRAFAKVRLKALPISESEIGLSAAQRGIFCHQSLDIFWKTVQSQERLNAYSSNDIEKCIETSIALAAKAGQFEKNHYFSVEQQRLKKILSLWLETEKSRPPFTVIERETKRHIQIGQLKLRIQIDRIDEFSDGQQIIIDYKTGKNNKLKDWLGERILQPQLPMYCLYGNEKAIGIAYAEINLTEPQFNGIMHHTDYFSKIIPAEKIDEEHLSWQERCQRWQYALEQLSAAFCEGKADVDPESATACRYCELQTFCRIGNTQ